MTLLKTLSIVSAVISLIFTFLSAIGSFYIWSHYYQANKENEKWQFQNISLWLWIVLSISNALGFLSTILLLRGIAKDKHQFFQPFFFIMLFLITFLFIQALSNSFIQEYGSFSATASDFFSEFALCVFFGIIMIPCFKLYTKLSGHSFFAMCHKCCPCCINEKVPQHM